LNVKKGREYFNLVPALVASMKAHKMIQAMGPHRQPITTERYRR